MKKHFIFYLATLLFNATLVIILCFRFTINILFSYLLSINKELEESSKILREASNILKIQEIEECKNPQLVNIKNVLWHVVLACEVNGLVKTQKDADITEVRIIIL